jgi:hypothetical protein
MLKVELLIDNKTAHSCSPIKFLEKFILLDAKEIGTGRYDTPYAIIDVESIEQI